MGSLIIDATVVSDSVHSLGKQFYLKKGSKIEIDKLQFNLGGSAYNIAFGASRLGLDVGVIGAVGYDSFGKSIFESLRRENVDDWFVKKTATRMTGYSTVIVGPDGERTIMVYRGANDMIDPDDIKMKYIGNSKAFLFTSITGEKSIEALRKAVKYAEKKKLTIIANPSINMIKKRREELSEIIKTSKIIIMNEEEALSLSSSRKISTALDKLIVGRELVVVTMGSKGAIAFDGFNTYKQDAFKTRLLDATGAGDAFTAGFVRCYLKKRPIPLCLEFGVATASLVMSNYGATNNYPTKTNIIRLMRGA